MKKFLHFLVTVIVLAGLGWALWRGIRKQADKPDEEHATTEKGESPPAHEEKAEGFVVMLEKEKWETLALAMAEPGSMLVGVILAKGDAVIGFTL